MDYKYNEQLLERYWNAETTLEEERILRLFFSQDDIPAAMSQWKPLFTAEAEEEMLGNDFDARILDMIGQESKAVKAQEVKLSQRLMPLFKAAAVVAIILTIGGALQAPWDNSWNAPEDYAVIQQQVDTVAVAQPVQAENISDASKDSSKVMIPVQSKD